mmetsp:Transcript_30884/g.70628  ORF Transcript_30884/g.70628 Transcript_30884/m.70628 type:complete len:89 (+) Transcript_30884:224-490(+)
MHKLDSVYAARHTHQRQGRPQRQNNSLNIKRSDKNKIWTETRFSRTLEARWMQNEKRPYSTVEKIEVMNLICGKGYVTHKTEKYMPWK